VGLPSLRYLRLTNSPITDAGLRDSIAHMPALQLLDLGATRVTGAGMAHLRGLHRLETLILYSTEVTWEEARQVQGRPGHLSIDMEHEKTLPRHPIEVEEDWDQEATGVLN
jgi:hypothetical protein